MNRPNVELAITANMLSEARARIERLSEALSWFVDDDECSFDHHGTCQTHNNSSSGCCVADARALLTDTFWGGAAQARAENGK